MKNKFTTFEYIIITLVALTAVFAAMIWLNSLKTLGYVDNDFIDARIEHLLDNYSLDEKIE